MFSRMFLILNYSLDRKITIQASISRNNLTVDLLLAVYLCIFIRLHNYTLNHLLSPTSLSAGYMTK